MSTEPFRLAARFRHFADVECPDEPLYQAVCRIVAADPALLSLLDGARPEQQRPNLWLAAVHERLLAGEAHPLAAYYRSVGGTRAPDAALAACLAGFARDHEPALRERMRTGSTQTNEVGRCAVLWPALHEVARRAGNPRLALLDVGCSAGLNLGVDQYVDATLADGSPMLPCRNVGSRRPDIRAPLEIVQRRGIDPEPVAVNDAGAVRWLQACLWPGDTARAERLGRAVRIAQQHAWPVLRQPDCTAHVAAWLAEVPAGVQPVVFNSWVLTYFEPAALRRHTDTLTALVRETGAVWLSAEAGSVDIGVPPPPPARQPATDNATLWTLVARGPRGVTHDLLAQSHAHGRWMEWLA